MNFLDWLQTLPGAPTPTQAAKAADLSNATLLRHADRGQTTADNVIAIARAYGVPPIDALVDTGHLRADEVGDARTSIKMALRMATIAEKWDSIAEDIDGMQLVIGRFPRIDELEISELSSDSTPDVEAFGYVADSSNIEPEPGDDDYHDGP
ncbi:DNA-binding protein [Corynebacterium cystitidis]|uniref:DNA-binding protein n=1 Tax=Corynebacterium cystitidis TaxID=35757 RepID=UPI00211ED24A|nr:DNA-binding protein [Corynebacterium cystitidis]